MQHPETGTSYFVKPLERTEPFSDFLESLQRQSERQGGSHSTASVKYSQARMLRGAVAVSNLTNLGVSENDNLRDEYATLYQEDVEKEIRWASIALGHKLDVS